MKPIEEILPNILLSGLIGDSPSVIAKSLGYAGRTTVSRIMAGSAGGNAVVNFCKRLEEVYDLSEADLRFMAELLETRRKVFKGLNRLEISFEEVMVALIGDDYDALKPYIAAPVITELIRIRRDDGVKMSGILSVCFFKESEVRLEDLSAFLAGKFSDNAFGKSLSELSQYAPTVYSKLPERLKTVELGAYIIRGFYLDGSANFGIRNMIALKGITGRSYWQDDDKIALLRPVYLNDMSNVYYEFFHIYDDGRLENPGQLVVTDDNTLCLNLKDEKRIVWGKYELKEDRLKIMFNGSPESYMVRLRVETSRRLSDIDKSLTDDTLRSVAMFSSRVRLVQDVADVEIGRNWVIVVLSDGRRKRIKKDSYAFFKTVKAEDEVIVYEDLDDKRVYIEWIQSARRVALTEFEDC